MDEGPKYIQEVIWVALHLVLPKCFNGVECTLKIYIFLNHFLYKCVLKLLVSESHSVVSCHFMDYTVHGILQARILE